MKIFILCGGYGSRLDHEGLLKAKPMVKIGPNPVLIHIMQNYLDQNYDEFVLCLGNKKETIINYFLKDKKKKTKIIFKKNNHIKIKYNNLGRWITIDMIDTGKKSGTGGRIKMAYNKLNLKNDFMMTYGDGLCNVNIKKLLTLHNNKKSLITLTAVRPKQRYGVIKIQNNKILYFDNEKKKSDVYINGGFMVVSKNIIKYIKSKKTMFEKEPLNKILKQKKLYAFKHNGFWESLDTIKDKMLLNSMYKKNKFLWKFKR